MSSRVRKYSHALSVAIGFVFGMAVLLTVLLLTAEWWLL